MSLTKRKPKLVVIAAERPKRCPKCEHRLIVRTSRPLADGKHRVRYVVCTSEHCGYTEKQLVAIF